MKIIYYECFAGISGDMNLAAMLDCGVPQEHLLSELKKLKIEEYDIKVSKQLKMGISGTQVDVITDHLTDSLHNQGHSHGHGHKHKVNHKHRTYKEIKEIITSSGLSDDVKTTSISIFEKIAVAEAKIHNKTVDSVHFHEVGAIDSIVDIVGAAVCYHYLNPDKVLCSTLELGGGFVDCAHGKFPVPAPATTEILKNIPVKLGTVNVETTTPTGAAIIATLVNEFTDTPRLNIEKTSYGIGHRDMDIPNVLRVHIAEDNTSNAVEKATLIECNLDDMSPEHFGYIMDKLFAAGAHDVFMTPIIMKKSRPATKISVLCTFNDSEILKKILFSETTTLGIRTYEVEKEMLERKTVKVYTQYGNINIKVSGINKYEIKAKPEYDQCKEAALKHNVPLRVVIDEAIKIFNAEKHE